MQAYRLRNAVGASLGTAAALWACASLAAGPVQHGAEVSLPQAAYRITNWALEGNEGIWVETAGNQWYYGKFLSPCIGATPDNMVFKFNPGGNLDRFSHMIVLHPRQSRQGCAFKSFVAGGGPTTLSSQRHKAASGVQLIGDATLEPPPIRTEQLEEPLPEVLVEAGPVTRTVIGRASATNAPIESVTVDYHVRYSDLDLIKHADVMTLHRRVQTAAHDACHQLDELFPLDRSPQNRECNQDAIRSAAQQIQQAIAAAQDQADAGEVLIQ